MYTDNEILFPHQIIPMLARAGGPRWQALVNEIVTLPETHERTLAFMLMMVRIDGCLACETDSFRAMRGCSTCALQSLRRLKADDDALLALYDKALSEVQAMPEMPGLPVERSRSA
jgi:hypothetical protein